MTCTPRTWTHTIETCNCLVYVHTWTSQDGATIRATRVGGSVFRHQWEVEATEPDACGRWFAEETDGAEEAGRVVRSVMGRMRFPVED
jgi:hypothetical protein